MRTPCRGADRPGISALLVAGILLAGCGSDGSRGPVTDPPARPVALAHGTLDGHRWTLTVSADPEGNLCMGVNESGTTSDGVVGGGCGFGPLETGPEWHDISDVSSASDSDGGELYFGPTPAGAVRIRLESTAMAADVRENASQAVGPGCDAATPRQVVVPITHRLPRWAGDGGWFITVRSIPANACSYDFDAFLDRHGHRVANHNW